MLYILPSYSFYLSYSPSLHPALLPGSLQQEDSGSGCGSGSGGRLELGYLEEERVRVLARGDELKTRLTALEQQLQESKQEVESSHLLSTPLTSSLFSSPLTSSPVLSFHLLSLLLSSHLLSSPLLSPVLSLSPLQSSPIHSPLLLFSSPPLLCQTLLSSPPHLLSSIEWSCVLGELMSCGWELVCDVMSLPPRRRWSVRCCRASGRRSRSR